MLVLTNNDFQGNNYGDIHMGTIYVHQKVSIWRKTKNHKIIQCKP
jgi:hypothetical protein